MDHSNEPPATAETMSSIGKFSLIGYNGSRKHLSISIPSSNEVMSPHIKSVEELRVLGINLSNFSAPTQFFICVAGVFVFYLIYGYLQELIFSVEGFRPFGWYLTLVQFGFYSMFGLVELQLTQDKRRRIPGKTYMIIAFLTVGTMGLSNTSLGYLNYPTQVIFKCCKLIPVMIGGVFIQGKRYNLADVSAALCMSLGLIWFTLADSKLAPNFNLTGVLLISLALCADAAIGNVQEKAMKLHNGSNSEMVLYSYSIGFVYILTGLLCVGDLGPAAAFCSEVHLGRPASALRHLPERLQQEQGQDEAALHTGPPQLAAERQEGPPAVPECLARDRYLQAHPALYLSLHLSQGVCRRRAVSALHHQLDMADSTGQSLSTDIVGRSEMLYTQEYPAFSWLCLGRCPQSAQMTDQPTNRQMVYVVRRGQVVIFLQFCSIGVERCCK
uniref:Adenosine 3'-phospho 5'-phosphosulfate transporter 2 n=1 Tax=Gadus morhua TaxID=8049 RepID=A0A8C5B8D1_GADMO